MPAATLRRLMLTALLLGSAAAHAEEPIQSVSIKGVRDPAIMPYKAAYELLAAIAKDGNGKVELVVRVVSAADSKPLPDLEITLQGEHTFERLAIAPGGYLAIPLNPAALADNADFTTNQKKGSLKVQMMFVPRLPPAPIRYADITASIEVAVRARKDLLPWYLRLILPTIKGIGFCYPEAGHSVALGTGGARAASVKDKHLFTEAVQECAVFNAADSALAPDTVLIPEAGWEANYR